MFLVRTGSFREIPFKLIKFSGGELQPRLEGTIYNGETVYIECSLFNSDDVMLLALLVDAIRRNGGYGNIHLICPYLPYARQDRECAVGESLALKVMCDFINALEFSSVTVWDVHSDVSLALLNRAHSVHQKEFVRKLRVKSDNTILVAPDAGAIKKTLETAKELGMGMVRADKIRSVDTGEITGTTVYSDHIGDDNFLIVDDICDGGRTFLELAKVLRPLTNGKINLYVTHGIFSKGLVVFEGLIDHVYTANPFPGFDKNNPIASVI